jgi:16S rRNA (uracil1498-N3)-methyltransferase
MRVLVPRAECPSGGWEAGKRVSLDESEVHHLRVRRAKDRETVEILDGAGLSGTGQLIQSGREWMVEVSSTQQEARPPALTLAVAAGDRERFSWMVEKSVELGVTSVVPLQTARSGGVATRLKAAHLSRLRRSALEATKQCGAAWAPSVEESVSLEEFARRPLTGIGWLADNEGEPVPAWLNDDPLTVVVGPEGGFTSGERASLAGAGFIPMLLGPNTLRFETAAIAAAAAATQARMRGLHG